MQVVESHPCAPAQSNFVYLMENLHFKNLNVIVTTLVWILHELIC